jgi:hypothetical protein
MVTRKGDAEIRRIKRWFPHRVALPADAVRGAESSTAIYGIAKTLAGALPPYRLSRDGRDYLVFCFSRAEAAQTFAERFGGESCQNESRRVA